MASTQATPSKPSEVGWQFVSQYYTFVNKQPNRLHCFYTKNSAFIHGTEGEDGRPCYGQHEIHEKILSIGFQDCKVFIHSVDAQASANNGIIIQAIGEMSNNSEPWRKFAQTFFLAEQPNGYFVLNDIFRYLKEDDVDDEVLEDEEHETTAAATHEEEIVPEPAPAVEANYAPNALQQSRADPPPAVEAQLKPVEALPEAQAQLPNGINGHHHDDDIATPASPEPVVEAHVEPPAVEVTPEEVSAPEPEPITTAPSPPSTPPPAPKAVVHEAPATPEVAAASTPTPPVVPSTPSAAASTPTAPPSKPAAPAEPEKPKTWANLAAAKPNAWGAIKSDSKGTSSNVAPLTPAATPPRAAANGPTSKPSPPVAPSGDAPSPGYAAALAVTTTQCFVKAVIETVDAGQLRAVLEARFGPVKELDIVRAKACAFLEFERLDSAKKAIIASLRRDAGGEGGIRIGEKGSDPSVPVTHGDAPRIIVETRKERGDRPPPRPRGGAPTGGDRGGARGGIGGGRGRGAPRGTGAVNGSK